MPELQSYIITIAVSFLLLAILFPIAMTQMTATNTTAWSTSVTTIYTVLLPILVIIGAAISFVPRGKDKRN